MEADQTHPHSALDAERTRFLSILALFKFIPPLYTKSAQGKKPNSVGFVQAELGSIHRQYENPLKGILSVPFI
jgi:hypothetical protein